MSSPFENEMHLLNVLLLYRRRAISALTLSKPTIDAIILLISSESHFGKYRNFKCLDNTNKGIGLLLERAFSE